MWTPNFVCFQRYSVDFNSRADEANIPLSTMGATAEAGTQNGQLDTNPTNTSGLSEDPRVSSNLTWVCYPGLKTFGNAEGSTKEAPMAEEQVEEKGKKEKKKPVTQKQTHHFPSSFTR